MTTERMDKWLGSPADLVVERGQSVMSKESFILFHGAVFHAFLCYLIKSSQ